MKKNYSTPEFMLVALGSHDIVCTSGEKMGFSDRTATGADAKRRDNNIWEE